MNILIIGDPHFKKNNVSQVHIFLNKLKEYLSSHPLQFIVVVGDVLHTHENVHSELLNLAVQFVQLLSSFALTYVLVGNHDAVNNSIFLTPSHWMCCLKEYKNVVIVDTVIEKDGFVFCPYVPNGRFLEALQTTIKKEELPKITCIFAHQELSNAKMGCVISKAEEWDKSFPLVISGHIHEKHWAQSNVFYTGSILQHAFGDSSDKTLLLLSISSLSSSSSSSLPSDKRTFTSPNGKICLFEEIDLDLPKKYLYHYTIQQFQEPVIQKLLQSQTPLSEYKVVLSGDEEEFKCFQKTYLYKQLSSSHIKVVFKHSKKDIEFIKKQYNENLTQNKTSFSDTLHHLIESSSDIPEIEKQKMYEFFQSI